MSLLRRLSPSNQVCRTALCANNTTLTKCTTVKRRFIRQNREFARVNSNQSIKIRTLETEVTELINENRQLREQILSLHNELQKHRGSPNVFEQVSNIHSQLQERLRDLQGLVGGLEDVSKPRRRKRTTLDTSALLQIDRKSKMLAMQPEGIPSPIMEGKYYPRRTIESVVFESLPSSILLTNCLQSKRTRCTDIQHNSRRLTRDWTASYYIL